MGVRAIASVIPTAMDIKVPRAISFSTAALKVESGSSVNTFTESDPTLDQFTLSAFMSGVTHTISWELAQDVPSFQQFAVSDLVLAIQMLEESLYVSGTGTGQAQGLIGNTGAGVTGVAAGSDNYASELMRASFDVQGKLNSVYHPGACWFMARATGTVLRKAQAAANYFAPLWTRENGQDFFHGYPVAYSSFMPTIATGHTPILFGNFKDGYIIGDRGGSGINVKILDQPLAITRTAHVAWLSQNGRSRPALGGYPGHHVSLTTNIGAGIFLSLSWQGSRTWPAPPLCQGSSFHVRERARAVSGVLHLKSAGNGSAV